MEDVMSLGKRSTEFLEENALNPKGIEWIDLFGYTKGWNGESGKPVSQVEVDKIIDEFVDLRLMKFGVHI